MKNTFFWNPQIVSARDSLLGAVQLKCFQPIPSQERAWRINNDFLFDSQQIILLWSAFSGHKSKKKKILNSTCYG